MISDVLFDAADQIRAYQEHLPDVYEEMRFEINVCLAQMDLLRHKLDSSPAIAQAEHETDIDAQLLTDQPHE